MGTWWNRLLLHKQPSHTQLSHTKLTHTQLTTFPFCCKRGAWQHQPYFVWQTWRSGVLLGDTDLHFLSQAWHLWHWAGSGGALGFSLTPWFPWLFMRQAWHLMKSSVFHHLLSLSYLSHPAFTFLLLLIGRSWHVLKSIFSTYPPWRINVFWKTWLVATISLQPLKLFAASCLTLQTLCSYSTLFFAKPYLILQTLCSLSLNFTNSLQPLTQLYLALQTLCSPLLNFQWSLRNLPSLYKFLAALYSTLNILWEPLHYKLFAASWSSQRATCSTSGRPAKGQWLTGIAFFATGASPFTQLYSFSLRNLNYLYKLLFKYSLRNLYNSTLHSTWTTTLPEEFTVRLYIQFWIQLYIKTLL